MSKFKGDTFKFPDEVTVKPKEDGEELSKVEFEIEGEDPPKSNATVEKPRKDGPEIEIIDDIPEDEKRPEPKENDPDEEELNSYSQNVRKRIEKLTFEKRDEERAKKAAQRERAELERIAQAVTNENKRLQEYVQNGEKAYMEKVQALAQVELESAKTRMKQAYDAGDSGAMANAQEEMMLAGMKVQQAQNFRPAPVQQQNYGVQSTQQAPAPAQPNLDPKLDSWLKKNTWFGDASKKAMSAYAMGLHQELQDKYGDDFPRTDEYYTQIDAEMRRIFPGEFGQPESDARDIPKSKPATVVAPSNRVTSAKKIRLTQTQVAIAKRLGVPLEEYAKHVAAMEKQ